MSQSSSTSAKDGLKAALSYYSFRMTDEHLEGSEERHSLPNLNPMLQADSNGLAGDPEALGFDLPLPNLSTGVQPNSHRDEVVPEIRAMQGLLRALVGTPSSFLCVVQIALLTAAIEVGGFTDRSENPFIGPPVHTLVHFGAKQAGLIVHEAQVYRLGLAVLLNAGILHIIPNVLIQWTVGAYMGLIFTWPRWIVIYVVAGVFGEVVSCLFLPWEVGVGSSGALMGLLSAWLVWLVLRWHKVPSSFRLERNLQMGCVSFGIVITLISSIKPTTDWGAHLGGAVQGALLGVGLLGYQMDRSLARRIIRSTALTMSALLYIIAVVYLFCFLHPPNDLDDT